MCIVQIPAMYYGEKKTLGYKIVFLANLDIPLCVYVYREFQGMPTKVLHRCY